MSEFDPAIKHGRMWSARGGRLNRLLTLGLIAGAGLGIGAAVSGCSEEDLSNYRSAPDTELANKHVVTLNTPPVSRKAMTPYIRSTMGVEAWRKQKGEWKGDYLCAGVAIDFESIITAADCVDQLSDKNNNLTDVITKYDRKKAIMVQRIGGRAFSADRAVWPKELNHDGNNNWAREDKADPAALFAMGVPIDSISVARDDPNYGESVYMLSRFGSRSTGVYGGRIVSVPDEEHDTYAVMYRLGTTAEDMCNPANRGTGMINKEGQLLGVNTQVSEPFKLSGPEASADGLASSEVGQQVVMCEMSPASQIRDLFHQNNLYFDDFPR